MATFHKITWQEFTLIKRIIESYDSLNLTAKTQKETIKQLISKCQECKKNQKITIPNLNQSEMQRIVAIVDMWPAVSNKTEEPEKYKSLSSKLQKAYYKEYNTKALHS